MLYLQGDGVKVLVLESGNIENLKKGRPIKTVDGTVLVAYTPDPVWLADKLMDCDGDMKEVAKLIDESTKRPEKPSKRPKHGMHTHTFGDKQ